MQKNTKDITTICGETITVETTKSKVVTLTGFEPNTPIIDEFNNKCTLIGVGPRPESEMDQGHGLVAWVQDPNGTFAHLGPILCLTREGYRKDPSARPKTAEDMSKIAQAVSVKNSTTLPFNLEYVRMLNKRMHDKMVVDRLTTDSTTGSLLIEHLLGQLGTCSIALKTMPTPEMLHAAIEELLDIIEEG